MSNTTARADSPHAATYPQIAELWAENSRRVLGSLLAPFQPSAMREPTVAPPAGSADRVGDRIGHE